MPTVVRAALVQANWTGGTESVIANHEHHTRAATRARRGATGLSACPWRLEQPAAAVANEYFVAAVNRVGREGYGGVDFHGASYCVDPRGRSFGDTAGDKEEELVVLDLDFGMIDVVRRQWAFHRDRCPDACGDLVEA
ncbi:hypothetical protein GCM10009753_62570 [Streptantibioticus ferralitis]|uniref:CN hydrolase domain-containing protein n=1 Tax=Streptantibioticus ferralitis TaxID=236510 RepID=A0ABT5Z3B5_9ACTN|nr:nitrilase-related carbon-nitrogen hydrolase [Streptantibioticus ferralitis]MDF2258152.1 hypothetical protein [Streptantibioticus ferralitis]